MSKQPARPLIVVNDPAEIPLFKNEAEEVAYWDRHEAGPGMFRGVAPVSVAERPPRAKASRTVPIRFDADTLNRLRDLAGRRGTRYQTLLKRFVIERLREEELKEGWTPPSEDGHTVRNVSPGVITEQSHLGLSGDVTSSNQVLGEAAMRISRAGKDPNTVKRGQGGRKGQ